MDKTVPAGAAILLDFNRGLGRTRNTMENNHPITVTIRAPKAGGFDRVTIIRGEDDGVPEHAALLADDETSVTIALKPE